MSESDLEHNRNHRHKSRFLLFNRKQSNCHGRVTSGYSSQRVHSEPTRRKFESGLQLNRSKTSSLKLNDDTMPSGDSEKSLRSQNLDFVSADNRLPEDFTISEFESGSVPGSPRRLAICAELEKNTFMENGETLLIGHRNLVIREFLESYAYI